MKNVLIVGLGLLGGSYAMGLSKKGHSVRAIEKNPESIEYAVKSGIIKSGETSPEKELFDWADLVVFALYPKVLLEFIKENARLFKDGTIITDVTGVKESIVYEVQSLLKDNVEFISAHPMAGKEVSGVKFADSNIFKNANYIVVPTEKNTPNAIEVCKQIGYDLEFKSVSVLSPHEHDDMIAFLSQLTHCIAVALMCSNPNEGMEEYTGDSFRDLTRIAKINDKMWSELFLLNRAPLLKQMDRFKKSFDELYESVKNADEEKMRQMMRLSTSRRERFDIKKEN